MGIYSPCARLSYVGAGRSGLGIGMRGNWFIIQLVGPLVVIMSSTSMDGL